MNCDKYQDRLAAYAEGDVTSEEKHFVESHLETCPSCRESLAFYVTLESSLSARHTLRPSPGAAARRVVRRLGLKKQRRVLPALTGIHGAISAGLVSFGILWLFFGGGVRAIFAGVDGSELATRFSLVIDEWLRALHSLAAGNELTLPILTVGITALILLTGSWMVLRYVRH